MQHYHPASMGLSPCRFCQTYTPTSYITNPGPNHVVHALLTIFLCGLWAPFWILIAVLDQSKGTWPHCSTCGRRKS